MQKIRLNTGIVLIFFFLITILGLFFYMNYEKDNPKNIRFSFTNNARTYKKVSCRVILNDSTFFAFSDISKAKDSLLELKEGLYKIEVSDDKGNLSVTEIFEIKKTEKKYIYIDFFYAPDYREFLPVYKEKYLDRLLKKKEYSDNEKREIKRTMNQNITIDYLKSIGYKPVKDSFAIKILNYQYQKI